MSDGERFHLAVDNAPRRDIEAQSERLVDLSELLWESVLGELEFIHRPDAGHIASLLALNALGFEAAMRSATLLENWQESLRVVTAEVSSELSQHIMEDTFKEVNPFKWLPSARSTKQQPYGSRVPRLTDAQKRALLTLGVVGPAQWRAGMWRPEAGRPIQWRVYKALEEKGLVAVSPTWCFLYVTPRACLVIRRFLHGEVVPEAVLYGLESRKPTWPGEMVPAQIVEGSPDVGGVHA